MKNCYIIAKTDISNKKLGPISITDIEKRTDITDIDIHIGKPIPKPNYDPIMDPSGPESIAFDHA